MKIPGSALAIHTSGNTVNVNVCFTMKLVTGQGHDKV